VNKAVAEDIVKTQFNVDLQFINNGLYKPFPNRGINFVCKTVEEFATYERLNHIGGRCASLSLPLFPETKKVETVEPINYETL
jgi:hypothetical protein